MVAALTKLSVTSRSPSRPAIEGDRLQLLFTSCDPVLAMETRVALTLSLVGASSAPVHGFSFPTPNASAMRLA